MNLQDKNEVRQPIKEALLIDIQNRIREANSVDELFNEVDVKLYEEEEYR